MKNRGGFVVWIGIVVLSGMFLMGQETWPPPGCTDLDGDGYGSPASAQCTYPEADCDDSRPEVNPGAVEGPSGDPTCEDGLDNDCDGRVDQEQCLVTLELVEGCNPFATSDECILPYPSAFFQAEDPTSPTGVRVDYPPDALTTPPGVPPLDMGPTNTADGVSPAGPILVHFAKDVHSDYLTGQREIEESLEADNPIALFNYETGERVVFMSEMDRNRKVLFPNRYALIVRPLEPMQMAARHVAVLTRDLTDATGNPLESPEAFAVLRDGILTTNEEIENVRPHYEELFAFLEAHGYARSNLLLAWDFMVASEDYLLGSVLSMRETALEEAYGTGMGYTITRLENNPNAYLSRLVEGTFEVPNYLNEDYAMEFDEDHHPIRQPENDAFPFTLLIPRKAETLGEPLPLVVFGHGLFGSGHSYLAGWAANTIHPLIEDAGLIMVATDWIGLSSGDLDLLLELVVEDINRISIVTDRLQQSLINNVVLTELALGDLSHDPGVAVEGHELIDPEQVYYYGVSLGGIQGSSFVSISPRVSRGVLSVPGCVWLNMIPRSINWVPIKVYMDVFYPDPLLQQMGISILQTRFDLSDPVNLTKLLFQSPLPDAPTGRVVLLQESIGDSQVPNLTTEMLARAINVNLMVPSVYAVHGLPTAISPSTDATLVQYHLVEQAEANPPPEENTPPTVDNGVHSDMVFLPHVVDQVFHFLETGEVVQACDGACDPD